MRLSLCALRVSHLSLTTSVPNSSPHALLIFSPATQSYLNQRVADLVPTTAQITAEAMAGVSMDVIMAHVKSAYCKAVTGVFYISIAGAVAGALVACLFRFVPLGEVHDKAAAAGKADKAEKEEAATSAAAAVAAAAADVEAVKVETAKAEAEVAAAAPAADPLPPQPDALPVAAASASTQA